MMPKLFMDVFGAVFEGNHDALSGHLEKIRNNEEARKSFYAGLILAEHRNLFIDNLCDTGLITHEELMNIIWDTPRPSWAL
jgi:hypothetical protein